MKHRKNTTIAAIALLLMLCATVLMTITPAAKAAVIQIDTYAHAMLAPDVVGVGQQMLVTFRIDKVAFGATDLLGHFSGFTVTITKPDNTTEVKGPYGVDSTSAGWFMYVPTQVGTYHFQTKFPGQWVNVSAATGQPYPDQRYYKPSTSAQVPLTVQQEGVPPIPDVPLPTGYWTRPINAESKGWWQIADNWLMRCYDHPNRGFCMTTAFAPYTSAPESAHVLWKKPIIFGGIGGGKLGDASYYTGLSYEQFYIPLVLNGRIIYTEHGPTGTNAFGTRVLNLYTGEEIMFLNNTDIAFAQVLKIDNPNEHGLLAYLWSTSGSAANSTWFMFDAFSGRQILTVINITWGGLGGFNGGPTAFGPKGEILSYSFSGTGANRRLICWNSTKAIYARGAIDTWSPGYLSTIDGSRGIQYNVSVPDIYAPATQALSISSIGEGYILAQTRDTNVFPYVYTDVCYKQDTGQQLWAVNRTEIYAAFFAQVMAIQDGIFVMRSEDKMTQIAYSIKTGERLWESNPLPNGWGIFEYQAHPAYGKVYTAGYTGSVWAYDAADGSLAWKFDFGSAGYENVYGTWPVYNGFTIADHKIYVTNDEHSPDSVLWRGGKLWCIDTDTGEGIWNISGWMRNPVIADGLLTALNSLDGQVYTFGKGPSEVTVSAPQTLLPLGTGVMITGTVTDQSPGQKGTPCISDASMASWMEYLHMQKPIPGDATGVTVKLSAIDPSGNPEDIGTVTSDMAGSFGIIWTPKLEGKYQVSATFEGTESYGSSFAIAYLGVGPAAPTPAPVTPTAPPTTPPVVVTPTPTLSPSQPPPPEEGPATELYIIAGAAIAIIAIAAAAALVLRRRK